MQTKKKREVLSVRESELHAVDYALLYYDRSTRMSWTNWITIMSSSQEPNTSSSTWERRSGKGIGYRNTWALGKAFENDYCGIYELRMVKDRKTVVVYVGSSCGTGKGVRSRLQCYARDGSHKQPFIDAVLSVKGVSIQARAKSYFGCVKEVSGKLEDELLAKYDYLWNVRKNESVRKRKLYAVAVIHYSLKDMTERKKKKIKNTLRL